VLNARESIGLSINQLAKNVLWNYVMKFCSSNRKAAILGTVRSA